MSKRAQESTSEERFGSGETEIDEFGVKEPLERKENRLQESSAWNSSGNQELDQSCVSSSVQATGDHCPVIVKIEERDLGDEDGV